MISFKHTGDFSRAEKYLKKLEEIAKRGILDKYGREGVEALKAATPFDTGKTADAWNYEIKRNKNGSVITFTNSNTNKGVNIAIILQYGHGTRNGGWVKGRDYINPAIKPIFDKIANEAWEEIMRI